MTLPEPVVRRILAALDAAAAQAVSPDRATPAGPPAPDARTLPDPSAPDARTLPEPFAPDARTLPEPFAPDARTLPESPAPDPAAGPPAPDPARLPGPDPAIPPDEPASAEPPARDDAIPSRPRGRPHAASAAPRAPLPRRVPGTSAAHKPSAPVTQPALPASLYRFWARETATDPFSAATLPSASAGTQQQAPQQPATEQQAPQQPTSKQPTPEPASAQPDVAPPDVAPPPESDGPRPPEAASRPPKATGPRPADRRPAASRQAPLAQRLRRRTRRRRAITSGVIVLVALAGLLTLMLNRHDTAAAGNRAVDSAGAAIRNRAAAWVAGQVSRAATVSCDPVMCQALEAHGIPAASLLELRPGTAGPLPSSVVIVTASVRGLLGSRYLAGHAPVAIAGFGAGSAGISIRVIAPQGAASYLSALGADVAARQAWAARLLRSKHIVISGPPRRMFAEGRVDPRLLADIASLAAQRPLSIVAFGDGAPGASPGIALRSAVLTGTRAAGGGRARAAGRSPAAQLRWMLRFLRAQRGAYLPASIQPVQLAAGGTGLRVEFAAPSPLGLLSPLVPRS